MTDPGSAQTIVFFDGVCHLCNAFVDFVVARRPHENLRFASLQGMTAARLLQPEERTRLETVLVWHHGKLLQRSDAVLSIFAQLGGSWRLLALMGRWIPRFLRDRIYDFVAKRRYAWFGRRDSCRLPTREERAFLLD